MVVAGRRVDQLKQRRQQLRHGMEEGQDGEVLPPLPFKYDDLGLNPFASREQFIEANLFDFWRAIYVGATLRCSNSGAYGHNDDHRDYGGFKCGDLYGAYQQSPSAEYEKIRGYGVLVSSNMNSRLCSLAMYLFDCSTDIYHTHLFCVDQVGWGCKLSMCNAVYDYKARLFTPPANPYLVMPYDMVDADKSSGLDGQLFDYGKKGERLERPPIGNEYRLRGNYQDGDHCGNVILHELPMTVLEGDDTVESVRKQFGNLTLIH